MIGRPTDQQKCNQLNTQKKCSAGKKVVNDEGLMKPLIEDFHFLEASKDY